MPGPRRFTVEDDEPAAGRHGQTRRVRRTRPGEPKLHAAVDQRPAGGRRVARCRRVPEDIARVGVDNWLPTAEGCRPALTSVDLNLQQVGRSAGALLLEAIQRGETEAGVQTVPCRLGGTRLLRSSGPACSRPDSVRVSHGPRWTGEKRGHGCCRRRLPRWRPAVARPWWARWPRTRGR
ncbi:substrate-binding domain-containing protein [Phytohabitans rumicis]|uniref:substrate-binding domain-containing protein n=1 Tax=Phytohabitans rumicis TaxID=1076125 RepID=UPI0015660C3C|nr:substrate-binding domain-containing protein [Phytohabitans rumicis]